MKPIINFGAIDIGSNAARLLIASVNLNHKKPHPSKSILLRIPLRLGEDVFTYGKITKSREKKFIRMMKAYKQLLKIYEVIDYKVYATSAMRDAENGLQISKDIEKKTGLEIEIIDGRKEANMIFQSHIAETLSTDRRYIYVDVGGGSTEITLIENKEKRDSKSFNIGTLRSLKGKVSQSQWNEMEEFLRGMLQKGDIEEIIGAGGNINKLLRLSGIKGDILDRNELEQVYKELNSVSLEERMEKFNLRPDRADVIIPAAEIFLFISKIANISKIYVPTIGLVDSIINALFEDFMRKQQ